MKHIRLIRHGESAANAGEPSLDHATTPLTQRGIEQANFVAAHPAHDIVVFSHDQLMSAVTWLIERNLPVIDGKAMTDWREYEIANHVRNCSGYILSKHQPDADWVVTQSVPEVGCPVLDDVPTMHAEQRMKDAGENRTGLRGCQMPTDTATHLSAREVCQVLRDVIFERHTMKKVGCQSWDEVYAGHFLVNVAGWRLSIYNGCDELDYCEEGVSPDGRRLPFDSGDRYGTDPVALLSVWEHQTLEKLLKAL